jgi:hypothetical protein
VTAGNPPARVVEIASDEQVKAWRNEEQAAAERIAAERRERVAAFGKTGDSNPK